MTDAEQTEAFTGDLERLIDRYRKEFSLTLATTIGCLEVMKLHLYAEQTRDQ